jgi:phosphonopyruvate decarboxylase
VYRDGKKLNEHPVSEATYFVDKNKGGGEYAVKPVVDGKEIEENSASYKLPENAPAGYVHVIFNNGAHDSVGGQPTVGLKIDLPAVARALGYRAAFSADSRETLAAALEEVAHTKGPLLLEVKVKKGNRPDLGRPTTTPIENKKALMEFLRK